MCSQTHKSKIIARALTIVNHNLFWAVIWVQILSSSLTCWIRIWKNMFPRGWKNVAKNMNLTNIKSSISAIREQILLSKLPNKLIYSNPSSYWTLRALKIVQKLRMRKDNQFIPTLKKNCTLHSTVYCTEEYFYILNLLLYSVCPGEPTTTVSCTTWRMTKRKM